MHSKIKFPIYLLSSLALTLLLLSGCSYFFDKKEKDQDVEFSSDHHDCFQGSHEVLKRYFNDFSNNEKAANEMTELGLCYQNAIDSFVKFTKSGEGESHTYTAEKFEQFFAKFYPQMGMSIGKIKGYIEFKQLFIGGSKSMVTKDEMMAVHTLLPFVTKALNHLSPYRAILLREQELEVNEFDREKFQEAFVELKKEAGNLLYALKPWSTQRSSDIKSLGEFVINEYYSDELEDKRPMINLVVTFKNLSLNERHEFIKRRDFDAFITQVITTYEALAEYLYFVEDRDKEMGFFDSIGTIVSFIIKIPSQLMYAKKFQTVSLPSLVHVIELSRQVLSASAKRNDADQIDIDHIEDFILALENAGYMEGSLTGKTLSYFIKQFSKGWLISNNPETGANIDRPKIHYITQIVDEWSRRQVYVNKKFENRNFINLVDFKQGDKSESTQKWLSVFDETALHQWLPDGRIRYSDDTSELSYEEMTVSNSIYTLVKVFMKPYSMNAKSAIEYSLKKNEAQAIYDLLRILGLEMAFVDARVDDTGEKAFLEGNNFTTQMRNDDTLDFYEAFELMSVIFSSGMLSDRIHEEFVETAPQGCVRDHKDVLKVSVLDPDCFRDFLKGNFGRYFSELESFNKFWKNTSAIDREKFIGVIEMSSRGGVFSKKPFDKGELRVMSGTMYYLESVFYNFDKDRDGLAKGEEILNAEKNYRPLVTDFIIKNKQDTIAGLQGVFEFLPDWMDGGKSGEQQMREWAPAIFLYILKNGTVPEGTLGSIDFFGSRNTYADWAMNAEINQAQVVRVFGALAATTGNGHRRRVEQFLLDHKDDLYQEIAEEEVPDCRVKENLAFCRWARLIYCNETVNADLYDWMNRSQLLLFPDEEWRANKYQTVKEAMVSMSRFFRTDKVYSTQCAFPEVEPEKGWWEWAQDGFDSTWNGTPTDKGVKDHVDATGNWWSEKWNSLMGGGEEEAN